MVCIVAVLNKQTSFKKRKTVRAAGSRTHSDRATLAKTRRERLSVASQLTLHLATGEVSGPSVANNTNYINIVQYLQQSNSS